MVHCECARIIIHYSVVVLWLFINDQEDKLGPYKSEPFQKTNTHIPIQRVQGYWDYNMGLLGPEECFSWFPGLEPYFHFSIVLISVCFFSLSGFAVKTISSLSIMAS